VSLHPSRTLPDCSGVVRRYVVVKVGEELYGIDANCASCKFPVIEGNVSAPAPHTHRCFSFLADGYQIGAWTSFSVSRFRHRTDRSCWA
jgi:hypothetical protein